MKYFKIFNTEKEYTEYIVSEDYITPNVSILRDCSRTWINGDSPEPEEKNYFAFVARENATFSFSNPIEYSLDSGITWTTLAANTQSPSIASGDTIMWKKTVAASGTPAGVGTFSATGNFDAEGNAMSLIYGDNFANEDSLEDYPHALQKLFSGNTHIINAENMELPALFLSSSCYDNMFFECYKLETAPELPASNLTPYCYRSMFEECTSLTAMPSMGMVAVAEGSCQYMFYSATSLTTVIEKLEPLSLAEECYDSMFEFCTSLTQGPELPATELVSQCYNHMFNGCTHLSFIKAAFVTEPNSNYTHEWVDGVAATGQFFKGINAEWDVVGVNGVPSGWTILSFETVYFSFACKDENGGEFSFTKATASDTLYWSRDYGQTWNEYTEPISTVYNENIMFKGELTANSTNGIGKFSVNGLFNVYGNVMSLIYGDNFKNQTALKADYNFAHLLEGCTHLVEAFELVLPSATLRAHCYVSMFKGCESISNLPHLKAMNLAEGCYSYMYYGCETVYALDADYLPATTLSTSCYSHMFEGSGLGITPYLPAETLVSGCYDYMFANTEVHLVQSNFTTEPGTSYTNNWLADVSEYGTFIVNSSAVWALDYDNYRGESGIPAYTAETEPGVTAYTWNVVGSDYETRWVSSGESCSANTTLRYELFEEQYSDDGGQTWHSFEPKVYSAKTIAEKSIECGFLSGDTDNEYDSAYIDTQALSGADLTFVNVEGAPNIKTDASGYVTSFEYTAASDDSPVMFNGSTTIDTDYHAFRTNGTNFKITMRVYCDGNDQVYKAKPTYPDDDMVNLLTVRGESGGSSTYADGFSFRISKAKKMNLVVNGNAQGVSFENPYIVDDGTHLWNFKIYYIDGVLKIYDVKNNRYVPNTSPWNTTGKTCNFLLDNGCSAVLACAVQPDGSYYRYCKCKFFEFKLETLEDIYEWRQAPAEDYMCVGEDKYYKEYYELSRDGGDNWTKVEPVQVRQGALIEEGSSDCICHFFTIRSLANNNTFTIKNNGTNSSKKFSYSTDDGDNWTDFTLANNATQTIATINSGDTILMRGDNETLGRAYSAGCVFHGSGYYEVEGNLASLLYPNGQSTEITGGTFHFAQLFSGDTHLISAENLQIASTTLFESTFNSTFRACTNLQKAPDLSIPTTLGKECYGSMFEGCIALAYPPETLNFTSADATSFNRMFCMSRGSKITTPAMTYTPKMYGNWGSITPKALQMFCGNGNLTNIYCYWTNNSSTFSSFDNWVNYTADSGVTFTKRSTQSFDSGVGGIKTGWTVVDDDVTGA